MPTAATIVRRATRSHADDAGSPITSGTTNAVTVAANDTANKGAPARSSRNGVVRSTCALAHSAYGRDEHLCAKPNQHRMQRVAGRISRTPHDGRNSAGEVGDQRVARLAARDDSDAGGKRQEQPGRQRDQRQGRLAGGLPGRSEQRRDQRLDRDRHRGAERKSQQAGPGEAAIHARAQGRQVILPLRQQAAASAATAR